MTYVNARAADAAATYDAIWAPLRQFNIDAVGHANGAPFALTITRENETEIVGGLWAQALWGSFYIALVVVPAAARRHRIGTELMQKAEDEARRLNCRQMWLDTYAFQARAFYERLGFTVFGQIDGPAPMFPRFFMQKLLGE